MTRRFQCVEGELEVYCRGSKGRNKNGAVLKEDTKCPYDARQQTQCCVPGRDRVGCPGG